MEELLAGGRRMAGSNFVAEGWGEGGEDAGGKGRVKRARVQLEVVANGPAARKGASPCWGM